jgi:hypothetical protein
VAADREVHHTGAALSDLLQEQIRPERLQSPWPFRGRGKP